MTVLPEARIGSRAPRNAKFVETRRAAYETLGTQHARRFHAAARLTSQERRTVINFLRDMTAEISKPAAFSETVRGKHGE